MIIESQTRPRSDFGHKHDILERLNLEFIHSHRQGFVCAELPNLRETSWADFWHHHILHPIDVWIRAAVGDLRRENLLAIHHYQPHIAGFAIEVCGGARRDVGRVFRFTTCRHERGRESRPPGHRSGIHAFECPDCGFRQAWDTSD